MSVTTAIVLDKRRMIKKTKNFPVCVRVTFNRDYRRFPIGIEMSESDFDKLQSPRIGEKLRETKEKLEMEHQRAKAIIKNLNNFSFAAFSDQFGAFHRKGRRKARQSDDSGQQPMSKKEPMLPNGNSRPRENFVNQFGKRKYPREKSKIDFPALGEVATYYGVLIEKLEAKEQAGTINVYMCSLMNLLNYQPNLRFCQITDIWLHKYEKAMKNLGRSVTTISMYLRVLRRVFNYVINKKIIDKDLYPFGRDLYVIPAARKRKKALTVDEIELLFSHQVEETVPQMCKDLWFFMYIGNGMNVKDMCLLKFKNIKDGFCRFIRAKTINTTKEDPQEITFYCGDEFMLNVIAKWGNKNHSPENYIFPFLEPGMDGYAIRHKVQLVTHMVNNNMYAIAGELGLAFEPGTNDARHAFVTRLKHAGFTTGFVREMIGHEIEKTTENYMDDFEDKTKVDIVDNLLPFRKKAAILRDVEPGISQAIVLSELDRIEMLAASSFIPGQKDFYPQFTALGFIINESTTHSDVRVNMVNAAMPDGWTRTVNVQRDCRVEIFDGKGRLRIYFEYKPGEFLYPNFYTRYTIDHIPGRPFDKKSVQLCVMDNQTGTPHTLSTTIETDDFFTSYKMASDQLKFYLKRNLPNWESPTAYWD